MILSQSYLRTELEDLLLRLSEYVEKLVGKQEEAAREYAQLMEADTKLKAEHEGVLVEMRKLKVERQALVKASDELSSEHESTKVELAKARDALAEALRRAHTADFSAQTDPLEPEIMVVEQPPSQETLAEIAEQVRKEFAFESEALEKMKSRNEYLERKEATYARMKEELDTAQALLANIGAKTAAMSNDLVEAQEVVGLQYLMSRVVSGARCTFGVTSLIAAFVKLTVIISVHSLPVSGIPLLIPPPPVSLPLSIA